jgi:hypothetical protein
MALLVGNFRLRILEIRRKGPIHSCRYKAEVLAGPNHIGQTVSVRFNDNDHEPENYLERETMFDGVDNDIRTADEIIKTKRPGATCHNPFDP